MVRQYKIHTNLDGANNKIWDVTNGKLRFYQPSNLGLDITNNISVTDGIGVVGSKNLTHPDIEFKLETFCDTVKENYEIFQEFINDLLSVRFVTLEYSTEWFQVYADLALQSVTKTEGYGRNGQFSETISFQVVTKWYTYENLTFEMIQNGEVIEGKSKIYGGYKGNETALQNYNRLKANPSLNLPNLNLLTDSKDFKNKNVAESSATTSITSPDSTIVKEGNDTYLHFLRPEFKSQDWFRAYMIRGSSVSPNFPNVDVKPNSQYTFSVWLKGTGTHTIYAFDKWTVPNPTALTVTLTDTWTKYILTVNTATTIPTQGAQFFIRSGTVGSEINLKYPKVEQGSVATEYIPSSSEITTNDISEYFGYNYIENQAYTYYGEEDINRLSRWDIKDKIFSVVARLDPASSGESGVRFLDTIGNEYTAVLFKPETKQDYILINTDVNDEFYQGWTGTSVLNLFPVLDFERYRTRIIDKGQMLLVNLKSAEFKIKRKADFV